MVLDPRGPERDGYCKRCRKNVLAGSYYLGFCSECLTGMTLVGVEKARQQLERPYRWEPVPDARVRECHAP